MIFNNKINKRTKRLLLCGSFGCVFFIGTFLLQRIYKEGYNSLRFPISSFSIGDFGWIQMANFILSGSLIFLSALGLRQAITSTKGSIWFSRLIGWVGLGLVGAGIFSSDPIYGYPVTEPFAITQFTIHGHLHDLFSLFVFICLPIAGFKFRNRFKKEGSTEWASYCLISGTGMLITFALAAIGFKQVPGFVAIAGVWQRLSILIGFSWIAWLNFTVVGGTTKHK